VPVLVNNTITLNFTVDSGASDVVIPLDVFTTLLRAGTIQETDLLGTKTYTLGDGSTRSAQTFRLRSLTLGGKVIEDITGSVAPVEGPLLLGLTFLERFKSWSIDNTTHSLVLSLSPTRDVPPPPPQPQQGQPGRVIAWTMFDLTLRQLPDPHADSVLPPPYHAIPQGSQVTVIDDCKIWTASGRGAQDADNVWCPTIYGDSRGWANAYLMTANDGRRLACIKYPNANGCPR
jgi:gag-polyprotein putative aspartyl protease